MLLLRKIISGGQTGADQAGLDVAIKNGIPHGGAIPEGRLTEDGILPDKYQLEEMSTKSYPKRTEKNVLDSDGTVILTHGKLTGGSLLTRKKAEQHDKPVLHLDMTLTQERWATDVLQKFVEKNQIETLNVAGSRASKDSEIYGKTFTVVEGLILRGNDDSLFREHLSANRREKIWKSAVVNLFNEVEKPSRKEMYDALISAGVSAEKSHKYVARYHQLAYALKHGVAYNVAGWATMEDDDDQWLCIGKLD